MSSDFILENFQGDSLEFSASLKDSAGDPIDLTGVTFRLAIGAVITESTSGVSISSGSSSGIVSVSITYSAMEALTDAEYEMALEYTIGTIRKTIFVCTLRLVEDVR